MKNPSYQGDSYYICPDCGQVEHDFNTGNTFQIDQTWDKLHKR